MTALFDKQSQKRPALSKHFIRPSIISTFILFASSFHSTPSSGVYPISFCKAITNSRVSSHTTSPFFRVATSSCSWAMDTVSASAPNRQSAFPNSDSIRACCSWRMFFFRQHYASHWGRRATSSNSRFLLFSLRSSSFSSSQNDEGGVTCPSIPNTQPIHEFPEREEPGCSDCNITQTCLYTCHKSDRTLETRPWFPIP